MRDSKATACSEQQRIVHKTIRRQPAKIKAGLKALLLASQPVEHLTFSEPQNQPIDVFKLHINFVDSQILGLRRWGTLGRDALIFLPTAAIFAVNVRGIILRMKKKE